MSDITTNAATDSFPLDDQIPEDLKRLAAKAAAVTAVQTVDDADAETTVETPATVEAQIAPATSQEPSSPIKKPYIRRGYFAPATGARFLPGRLWQPFIGHDHKKIIFPGVPYYEKIVQGGGEVLAGVPFGPGNDNLPEPGVTIVDSHTVEDGGLVVRAGFREDKNKRFLTVEPRDIEITSRDGKVRQRKQVYQYGLEKKNDEILIMPPEEGKFVWEIWTGFYSVAQISQARILHMHGQFLHGAGPYQGAQHLSLTGETASTSRLTKSWEKEQAQEVRWRIGMVDGLPLWIAYYFVAQFSRRACQGVLVRQLNQTYLLLCNGGKPTALPAPAEQYKADYNEMGIPVPYKMAA